MKYSLFVSNFFFFKLSSLKMDKYHYGQTSCNNAVISFIGLCLQNNDNFHVQVFGSVRSVIPCDLRNFKQVDTFT